MNKGKQARPHLTHFLCLPLVTLETRPQLQESLKQFAADLVTSGPDGIKPIPEKAIRPVDTLHLTLGVMSLTEPERLARALELLNQLDVKSMLNSASTEKLLEGSEAELPLVISLKSVISMHPPSSTSILFSAPADPANRLLPFCQKLRELFVAEELVEHDDRPLLLHATIVNTVYASERGRDQRSRRGRGMSGRGQSSGEGHGINKAKLTMDATEIISRYEEFPFIEGMRIPEVAICRMGVKKTVDPETGLEREAYEVIGSIPLP